jgi:hypothetical protein
MYGDANYLFAVAVPTVRATHPNFCLRSTGFARQSITSIGFDCDRDQQSQAKHNHLGVTNIAIHMNKTTFTC